MQISLKVHGEERERILKSGNSFILLDLFRIVVLFLFSTSTRDDNSCADSGFTNCAVVVRVKLPYSSNHTSNLPPLILSCQSYKLSLCQGNDSKVWPALFPELRLTCFLVLLIPAASLSTPPNPHSPIA